MTVKQLIAKLQGEDPDRLVVMARDNEGNSYTPLDMVVTGAYKKRETLHELGKFGLEKLTPALRKEGYSEEDVVGGGVKALVLWPRT